MRANVLRVLLSALGRGAARRSLARDRGGAAGVYVAIVSAAMVGMAGLALDLGRLWTINTQAQDAADAAALAAASQLDQSSTATTRAYNAATTTTLVQNKQAYSGTGGTVTMQSVDFLNALPASDTTPITSANILCSGTGCTAAQSAQANFVRVTTSSLPHQNFILSAFGARANSGTSASAVAGNTKLICRIPPLFACNPDETATNTSFNVGNWQGKQVHLKAGSTSWAPGNFGLLQAQLPNCTGLATTCIQQQIADISPDEPCVGSTVQVKPGVVNGMREAMNTRFDMWENPGFKGQQGNANYAPAPDVTKGLLMGSTCSKITQNLTPTTSPKGMAIPQDTVFSGQNTAFGNGVWDCATYWSVNHSGVLKPSWCTSTTDATANFPNQSRFAMYQSEISNNQIPNNSTKNPKGENGNPTCAPAADTVDGANRRILYFALVNCLQNANQLKGNSGGPIPTVAFVKAFVTEPVLQPPGTDILIEVEGVATPGDGVLHDIVQLYR